MLVRYLPAWRGLSSELSGNNAGTIDSCVSRGLVLRYPFSERSIGFRRGKFPEPEPGPEPDFDFECEGSIAIGIAIGIGIAIAIDFRLQRSIGFRRGKFPEPGPEPGPDPDPDPDPDFDFECEGSIAIGIAIGIGIAKQARNPQTLSSQEPSRLAYAAAALPVGLPVHFFVGPAPCRLFSPSTPSTARAGDALRHLCQRFIDQGMAGVVQHVDMRQLIPLYGCQQRLCALHSGR